MTAAFAPYGPTIVAFALWAVLVTGLARVSGMGAPLARTESGHPVQDYADPAYRRVRAHLNAVETSGPFLAAAVAAMLAGGPPFWVNALAIVFLLARIGMAVVHVGTQNQPARSVCFVLGVVCIFGLSAFAIAGVIGA